MGMYVSYLYTDFKRAHDMLQGKYYTTLSLSSLCQQNYFG
jgi:hypothetical protein